jgi:hypothetical protein
VSVNLGAVGTDRGIVGHILGFKGATRTPARKSRHSAVTSRLLPTEELVP